MRIQGRAMRGVPQRDHAGKRAGECGVCANPAAVLTNKLGQQSDPNVCRQGTQGQREDAADVAGVACHSDGLANASLLFELHCSLRASYCCARVLYLSGKQQKSARKTLGHSQGSLAPKREASWLWWCGLRAVWTQGRGQYRAAALGKRASQFAGHVLMRGLSD